LEVHLHCERILTYTAPDCYTVHVLPVSMVQKPVPSDMKFGCSSREDSLLNCSGYTSLAPHALYTSLTLSWSSLEYCSQTSPYVISGHIMQNLSFLLWKILAWWAAVEPSLTFGSLE